MSNSVVTTGLGPELFWLAAVATLTVLMWIPYTLQRIFKFGMWPVLKNPSPETTLTAGVGKRLVCAHANALENLPVFAALVLVAVLAQRTSPLTANAAAAYFFARVMHYLVYVAGIPVLRTLAFAAGWAACLVIAASIFHLG
jgi:uncharacterized MAPEG superfamily protein